LEIAVAADISFWAGEGAGITDLANSGLGFYGAGGFGASVVVGEWQGRTFITNSDGTAEGPEVDNCKWASATSVILGQEGTGISLDSIPNYLATLNVRFTYDSPVRVQNATFQIYDRSDLDNPATGVTFAAYEVVHPGSSQTPDGSGGPSQTGTPHEWVMFEPTGVTVMSLSDSPGTSGLSPSGSSTEDTRHDFFLALSCSPESIGSKLFGGYVSLEYL
jgi:hypothetical protein